MKRVKNIILFGLVILAGFASCIKLDDPEPPIESSVSVLLIQGTWKISQLNINGNDKTPEFEGYNCTFSSNGTVVADKTGSQVNGIWSTGTINNMNLFSINFGTSPPFNQLNNNWQVTGLANNKLTLNYTQGGNSGTDVLSFDKN